MIENKKENDLRDILVYKIDEYWMHTNEWKINKFHADRFQWSKKEAKWSQSRVGHASVDIEVNW